MVLRGRLKVWVGDEIHFLDRGDSIWFGGATPHRAENVADEPTETSGSRHHRELLELRCRRESHVVLGEADRSGLRTGD